MLSSPDLPVITPTLQGPGMKVLVYSCYFGQYEPYNPKATGDGAGYDRVVVTDQALSAPGIRLCRLSPSEMGAPALGGTVLSRWAKLCPHRFFAGYDWVIYIDNSASLMCDPLQMIGEIVADQGGDAPAGRYLFPHQRRTCAYREARLCMKKGRIPRADYRRQIQHFQAAGFPMDQGLYVNTMLVQKMGDPATNAFNEAWFAHFQEFSQRDQIGLPFLLWQSGLPARLMPQDLFDLAQWPVFKKFRRQQYQSAQRARQKKRALAA